MAFQRLPSNARRPFEQRGPNPNVPPYETKLYFPPSPRTPPEKMPEKLPPNYAPNSFQPANTVTIPSELFDKMFLALQNNPGAKPAAPQTYGNPTPLSVVGFLLSLSPLSCDLMGFRGAGGNGAASIGAFFFMGGVLMLLGGFLEFLQGNTFPFVVFASFGGFWFSYGATLLPFFNAAGAYSPDPLVPSAGLATRGFNASFGFFMLFMSVLCLIYLICSLRTNVVFVIIFSGLMSGFVLLTLAFWFAAESDAAAAANILFYAGAATFVADMAGWYLLLALLLVSVDFPVRLPLGDLSGWIKGYSEKSAGGPIG